VFEQQKRRKQQQNTASGTSRGHATAEGMLETAEVLQQKRRQPKQYSVQHIFCGRNKFLGKFL
jgi:hypothetical protein